MGRPRLDDRLVQPRKPTSGCRDSEAGTGGVHPDLLGHDRREQLQPDDQLKAVVTVTCRFEVPPISVPLSTAIAVTAVAAGSYGGGRAWDVAPDVLRPAIPAKTPRRGHGVLRRTRTHAAAPRGLEVHRGALKSEGTSV